MCIPQRATDRTLMYGTGTCPSPPAVYSWTRNPFPSGKFNTLLWYKDGQIPIYRWYSLVNEHSYWKWPFIVIFPLKMVISHSYVSLPEGIYWLPWNAPIHAMLLETCFFCAIAIDLSAARRESRATWSMTRKKVGSSPLPISLGKKTRGFGKQHISIYDTIEHSYTSVIHHGNRRFCFRTPECDLWQRRCTSAVPVSQRP